MKKTKHFKLGGIQQKIYVHKYFKKRGKMHEGLKNGKNDYKWRFVLNR